jgi:hypothetical protein
LPSYSLRRFAHPRVLQSVSPPVLLEFLKPHADFIASKGFHLPQSDGAISDFDYLMLTSILMKPDDQMPSLLIDALFFAHEMGTYSTMNKLLDLASKLGIDIPPDSTPMDVAMRIWIRDNLALEKAHSEQHIYRSRTFEHYQADAPMPFSEPDDNRLAEMEAVLDTWFENHKRGANSRVFVYPGEDEIWFLIRHGDAYKRESAMEGYNSKGIFYRPEAFDVACYVPSIGELRIHTKNKGEQDLYRRGLGRLIFGDSTVFPGLDKYDLSPIIYDPEKCLVARDIEGIDWIMLTEIRIEKHKPHYKLLTTYTAPSVFLAIRDDNIQLRLNETITRARFKVKFTGEDKPRAVTITPPNKLQLCRDTDSALVETWLRARGFIRYEEAGHGKESEEFLVGM